MVNKDPSDEPPSSSTANAETFQRLPAEIVPLRYELEYEPSWKVNKPTFLCKQLIRVKLKAPTTTITLNSVGLTFTRAYFKHERTEDSMDAAEIAEDKEDQRIRLLFDETLEVGVIKLFLEFRGTYTEAAGLGMKGIYRSPFKGADGNDDFNYLTYFSPTFARYAFPCFDEPEFKTNFTISLHVPPGRIALTNMPLKTEVPVPRYPGHTLQTFERTPLMSCHLSGWIIGDFEFLEEICGTIKIRIYTNPGKKELAHYPLQVAAKAFKFYQEYLGTAYALPKLDLVAVKDLPSSAMDNWGLITFREDEILLNEKESSIVNKQRVTLLVAKQIAHQWFGNFVTLQWWTDLWLYEGFPTLMSYICIDNIHPEYSIWEQFQLAVRIPAMEHDSLSSAYAVMEPIDNPSEIDEKFSKYSVLKGCAILRMLFDYIGEDAFKEGLKKFFATYQYNNARAGNLWQYFRKSSDGKKVSIFMANWTKQPGYPIITVVRCEQPEGKYERTVELHMEPFWMDARVYRDRERVHKLKWMVPISFCTSTEPKDIAHSVLFDGTKSIEMLTTVPEVFGPTTYVRLNVGNLGYYRVHYVSPIWAKIKPVKFLPLDRLGYLDDLFGVAKCGKATKLVESHLTCDVLKAIKDLSEVDDQHFIVWLGVSNIMDQMNQLFLDSYYYDRFHAFGRYVFQRIQEKLGWTPQPNEEYTSRLLRQLVFARLIEFGDRKIIKTANRLFDAYLKEERGIPPDFRLTIYMAVLSDYRLTRETINAFLRLYRESDFTEERLRIIKALGAIQKTEFLEEVLEFAISKDVLAEDMVELVVQAGRSRSGRELTWRFVKNNWDVIKERFQSGRVGLRRLVEGVAGNFTSKPKLKEVEEFFENRKFPGSEICVRNIIENIRINEAWLAKDGEKGVRKFLGVFIRYTMPNDIPRFVGLMQELTSEKFNPYIPPPSQVKTISAPQK